MIAFADSGDNIGIYLPLFASYSLIQTALATVLLLMSEFLLCLLSMNVGKISWIQKLVCKYSKYIVPTILAILGLIILMGF